MRIDAVGLLHDFYLMGDAARALGVSRITLWRWIKADKLQTYRIGREVLIEREVVDRLRKERR